jgi:hypothetical protein
VGFCTYLYLLPEKSLGVVVLANTFPAPVDLISNAALDILLGFELEIPKPPVIVSLIQTMIAHGLEAAVDAYRQMKKSQSEVYDFSSTQFSHIGYILVEIKRIPESIDILRLGIAVHPEVDKLYALLGLAYLECGEKDVASRTIQECLRINPTNSFANQLAMELEM